MVVHGGSSAGSYLADPTSPIPSHCASIVTTSTVRVKYPHLSTALLPNDCMKACGRVDRVLDLRLTGLGFDFHS